MEKEKLILKAFSTKLVKDAINGFILDLNDNLTNSVREYLDKLNEDEVNEIQIFLTNILNMCYDGKLCNEEFEQAEYSLIKNLNQEEKFKLKETIIYFSGRLPKQANLEVLKRAYYLDDDKYIKLNIAFSTLLTFDEEIELDFVEKLTTISEYDEMIRSWTMAFFKNETNPYEYKDSNDKDWTCAKLPRINRLSINSKTHSKFNKAIAYRLLDLVVIYLFIKNRNQNSLSNEEKEIINNARANFDVYSKEKKKLINDFKKKIIEY